MLNFPFFPSVKQQTGNRKCFIFRQIWVCLPFAPLPISVILAMCWFPCSLRLLTAKSASAACDGSDCYHSSEILSVRFYYLGHSGAHEVASTIVNQSSLLREISNIWCVWVAAYSDWIFRKPCTTQLSTIMENHHQTPSKPWERNRSTNSGNPVPR